MSMFSEAQVTVFVGDHISVDNGSGKVYGLGLGFQFLPANPATNLTPPMSLGVIIDMPSKYAGQQVPVVIELRDLTLDQVVSFIPPGGTTPEALRIQQLMIVNKPAIPGVYVPDTVPARLQAAITFPNGITVTPGHRYAWKVEIEAQSRTGWSAEFHVLESPPPPLIGGPIGASPSNLPQVFPPVDDVDNPLANLS